MSRSKIFFDAFLDGFTMAGLAEIFVQTRPAHLLFADQPSDCRLSEYINQLENLSESKRELLLRLVESRDRSERALSLVRQICAAVCHLGLLGCGMYLVFVHQQGPAMVLFALSVFLMLLPRTFQRRTTTSS